MSLPDRVRVLVVGDSGVGKVRSIQLSLVTNGLVHYCDLPPQPLMDHLTLRLPLHPVLNGPFYYFLYKPNGLKGPLHPLNGLFH